MQGENVTATISRGDPAFNSQGSWMPLWLLQYEAALNSAKFRQELSSSSPRAAPVEQQAAEGPIPLRLECCQQQGPDRHTVLIKMAQRHQVSVATCKSDSGLPSLLGLRWTCSLWIRAVWGPCPGQPSSTSVVRAPGSSCKALRLLNSKASFHGLKRCWTESAPAHKRGNRKSLSRRKAAALQVSTKFY